MKNNLKNDIIKKSRELIVSDFKIKKTYFIPGFLSIIILTWLLVYQAVYTYIEIFDKKDETFELLLNIFHNYFIEIIIIWIIITLVYVIILPIYEWWLIYYLDKESKWEKPSTLWMLTNSLYRFLPYFEYLNLFSIFKFISLINIYLFLLRFVWMDYIMIINYLFSFFLILSVIINILFVYSKFEIILNNKSAFEWMSESLKLSILNLWITIKFYFFMYILNIRVIINFLVFLLFPIIILTTISYITSKIFLLITIIILSLVFLFLILILWYLNWVLEIFKNAIWYNTYIYSKNNISETDKKD